MKKIKDFLKALNAIIKVPEIDGRIAASDLNDVEISGEAADTLSATVKSLLTEEAAKNNPGLKSYFKQQIYDSAKGELLGNVDTQLHTTVRDIFGEEALAKVESADFTKDKIKILQDIIVEHQTKKADDKTKLMVDGLKKTLEKNQDTYARKLSEKEAEIKKLSDGYEGKLVSADIKRRIVGKQFAEKYNEDDIREVLTETALKRITKEAMIKLDADGNLKTYDPENPDLELYIEGQKATVDDLIERHIGKYLAKSEPKKETHEVIVKEQIKDLDISQDPAISSLGIGIRTGQNAM